MSESFRAVYHVADGYLSGRRPQEFNIQSGHLEDDMDDAALRNLYHEAMVEDFEQRIFPEGANEDKFVEWALRQLAERAK